MAPYYGVSDTRRQSLCTTEKFARGSSKQARLRRRLRRRSLRLLLLGSRLAHHLHLLHLHVHLLHLHIPLLLLRLAHWLIDVRHVRLHGKHRRVVHPRGGRVQGLSNNGLIVELIEVVLRDAAAADRGPHRARGRGVDPR